MVNVPPRRILVAVDAYEPSLAAWKFARDLAGPHGPAPEAAYVEEVPMFAPELYVPPPRELLEDAKKRIRAVVGAQTRLHILRGDAAVEIVRFARLSKFDLLVLGTHGRRGLRLYLMGSVAESVVHRARTPVLTLREAARPVRSVLAPVNFTPYSDAAFRYAAGLAAEWKARLTVQHVTWGADDAERAEALADRLIRSLPAQARKACSPVVRIDHGNPVNGILREARRHQFVVLSAHRKYLLSDLVLGTTAERVLRHCRAPVLSIPAGAAGPAAAAPRTRERELAAA